MTPWLTQEWRYLLLLFFKSISNYLEAKMLKVIRKNVYLMCHLVKCLNSLKISFLSDQWITAKIVDEIEANF